MTTSRHARRDAARRLLDEYDLDAVERWASREPHAWAALHSLLFDPDEVVRWRAVEALGRVAAVRAREDVEAVRQLVLRALWLMNDESGGLLWLGPPLIGAILANVPALRDGLLAVLAGFLEEEPFRSGTRWALWRVALAAPAAVTETAGDALAASFSDPDPVVRGHAALALAVASGPAATEALAHDPAELAVFDPRSGTFRPATVAKAASGGL